MCFVFIESSYGRGAGVGRGLGEGVGLGVEVGVAVGVRRWRGPPCAQYLPPLLAKAAAADFSTPDDHFTASPYCRVILSARRRVGRAGVYPTVRAGIVSAAGIEKKERVRLIASAPHDHLPTCPYCCVTRSGAGRAGYASRQP